MIAFFELYGDFRQAPLAFGQWNGERDTELLADAPGDVPVASQVFGHQHVAGGEPSLAPVRCLKFRKSCQIDHILTPGGLMIVRATQTCEGSWRSRVRPRRKAFSIPRPGKDPADMRSSRRRVASRLAAGSTGVQPLPPGYGLLVRYAIVLAETSIHFGFGSLFGVTIALLDAPH